MPQLNSPDFGRWDHLNAFLMSEPPKFDLPSIAEYEGFTAVDRQAFDRARIENLGSRVRIPTLAMKTLRDELPAIALQNSTKPKGRWSFLVYGNYLSGKTTSCIDAMRFYFRWITQMYPGIDPSEDVPIAYVELPGHSTARSVVANLAEFYGVRTHGGNTAVELRRVVVTQMQSRGTRLVVIDELQNLVGAGYQGIDSANALKELYEAASGTTFIFCGSHTPTRKLFGTPAAAQLLARCIEVEHRDYAATAAGASEWNGAIVSFERRLGLFAHKPGTLLPLSSHIYERTGGNIARLNLLLTGAASRLIRDSRHPDEETITREVLDRVRLPRPVPAIYTTPAQTNERNSAHK